MSLVVSLRLNKVVMSLQSREETASIGIVSSSLEAAEELGIVQEVETSPVVFLYTLEPIKSPGNEEHYKINDYLFT